MSKLLTAVFTIAAMLAVATALAKPTSASSAPAAAGATPAVTVLPTVHHLVYRFGYNTKATKEGEGTGTTTIDIVGLAKDGGMKVTATDEWWNAVQPKQSSHCEVYANGSVVCGKAPYNLTVIQVAVVPLLGQNYFKALSGGLTSSWTQSYSVRATFLPGSGAGFAGQVYTWNCESSLNGKGTIPEQPPLVEIQSTGQMQQQGGRYIKVNQKAGVLYDPRIQMPVYVSELFTFVPRQTTNQYTVELKLIRT